MQGGEGELGLAPLHYWERGSGMRLRAREQVSQGVEGSPPSSNTHLVRCPYSSMISCILVSTRQLGVNVHVLEQGKFCSIPKLQTQKCAVLMRCLPDYSLDYSYARTGRI